MASQWRVPELLRSNVWEQWLRPFLCWLLAPRLELLRGSALGFQKLANYMARHYSEPAESGPDYTPKCGEPLNLIPPASRYVANISLRLNASIHGSQDGTAAYKPGLMSLAGSPPPGTGWFARWLPPRSCQRRRRHGHIRHQQPARLQQTRPITERVKTRPLNCSQSSSATPNSATTARNSLR